MKSKIIITFVFCSFMLVPFHRVFPAQMASESFRMSTSGFSSSWGVMDADVYSSQSILGQSSPIMNSEEPPYSSDFNLYPGYIYTLDAVLECGDIGSFASAYGSTSFQSNYNPACEKDFDGDIDGVDLSGFAEEF